MRAKFSYRNQIDETTCIKELEKSIPYIILYRPLALKVSKLCLGDVLVRRENL